MNGIISKSLVSYENLLIVTDYWYCFASSVLRSELGTCHSSLFVTALYSHAFAARHSRSTVGEDMPRTLAVSSIFKPPKYLNSTTCPFRGEIAKRSVRA